MLASILLYHEICIGSYVRWSDILRVITRYALVAEYLDRKSTRLNSSHS